MAVLVDAVAEADAVQTDPVAPPSSTVAIVEALTALGFEPVEIALQPGHIHEWVRALIDGHFRLGFNLCESVGGRASAEHLPAATVELLGLPMTGAPSTTLLNCLHKNRCSAVLGTHGVRVPAWHYVGRHDPVPRHWRHYPSIVKPAAEDASNGVHADSVVESPTELADAIQRLRANWGGLIVQQFVTGREINMAIVGRNVLPPSEIDFSELPEGQPPVVSYAAKWETDTPEYQGTRPICPAPLKPGLRQELLHVATRSWELMDGAGYARVDIRLADDSRAYVIDVNPNPDLSPDAGLARQAAAAGWSYRDLIERIVEEAFARAKEAGAASGRTWTFPSDAVSDERTA